MSNRTFSKTIAALTLWSFFASGSLAHASNLAQCLQNAILSLTDQPLVSSNDPLLRQWAKVPPEAESMFCGPACGVYLMQAVRKALGVPTVFGSQAMEAAGLASVGYELGQNVARDGMSMESVHAAIVKDLGFHKISADVDGLSLAHESPHVKKVSEIRLQDLEAPAGIAQASIVGIKAPDGGRHMLFVQAFSSQDRQLRVIEPTYPNLPQPLIFSVVEDTRTKRLYLSHPFAPQKAHPLAPQKDVTKTSPQIEAILRVRLHPSHEPTH